MVEDASDFGVILAAIRWCSEDDGNPLFVEHYQSALLDSGVERNAEMNWNDYFFGIVRAVAAKSKDQSVKIGAVIAGPGHEVLSVGYNGFPRGIDDTVEARHERPAKYVWTEHAERNAIYNAARVGARLAGSTIYLPCPPCSPCARGIIQAGIVRVVAEMSAADFLPARSAIAWREDVELAREMLREAGIAVDVYKTHDPSVVLPCIDTDWCGPRFREVQREFNVLVATEPGSLRPNAMRSDIACDNCGASIGDSEMLRFTSRGGYLWWLCADRPACRARRTEREEKP